MGVFMNGLAAQLGSNNQIQTSTSEKQQHLQYFQDDEFSNHYTKP